MNLASEDAEGRVERLSRLSEGLCFVERPHASGRTERDCRAQACGTAGGPVRRERAPHRPTPPRSYFGFPKIHLISVMLICVEAKIKMGETGLSVLGTLGRASA